MKIISKQAYRRATWKNGLGHTDEIAIFPEGSELKRGNFLWRLSSARIEQSSPFSAFPQHDRTLVVLKGEGLRLTHTFEEGGDDEVVELERLTPYDFPGDVPSRCELISGPIADLSVFVRKAEAEAVTEVVEVAPGETFEWVPAGRWNFVYAAQSGFEIAAEGAPGEVSEGDTLRVELDEPLAEDRPFRIRATGAPAKLVIVALQG